MSLKKSYENKPYDKIIKENLEATFLALSKKLLGIEIVKHETISEKFQTTQEREADFVRKVEDDQGNHFILQLEFQVDNDKEMVYRTAEYKAILQRKYKMEVRQFVVYMGRKKAQMKTKLPANEIISGFNLIDLSAFSHKELLNSNTPEEIILALLANLENEEPGEVIRAILIRLKNLSNSEAELARYLKQLQILSRLRKLENETKTEIRNMPITYDISTDGLYLEGKVAGKIEGKIEGKVEKGKEVILNLLNSALFKEGLMSYVQISEVSGFSVREVKQLHDSIKE